MLARYKWVERATAEIRFPSDREAVARELTEHIHDLVPYMDHRECAVFILHLLICRYYFPKAGG